MSCNDYNLILDGSSGGDEPTPEYNIYLDGVGINGFSPTTNFVNQTSSTFQIQVNDIEGAKLSSQIPLMSYITDNYVSNTSLASTLAGYLQVDGSNANTSFTVNGIQLQGATGTGEGVRISRGTSYNSIYSPSFSGGNNKGFEINYGTDGHLRFSNSLGYAQLSYLGANLILEDNKLYYGSNSASNELATIGDIPTVSDATITLTQGGVTKGTFTLNGSATTIDLDAGGSTITNPLEIEDTDSNNFISIGVDSSGANIRLGNTQGLSFNSYLIGNATAPLELTNGAFGDKIIKLNIDSNTLDINSDNKLTVIGGGGTTYTAGTGIDITSDVISIDTDVVAQLSDIPTNSDYVDLTSAQTITGKKTFSGAEIETNNIITLKGNAIIRGLYNTNDYSTYLIGSNGSLLVGNESHGITLRGNTARPVYKTGGTDYNIALSGDIPTVPTITTGSTNGTISVGGTDVSVYGLGSAAYTSSSDYVTNTDYATTLVGGVIKIDDSTIGINASGVISTKGVINQQDNTTTLKLWTGTKTQYDNTFVSTWTVSSSVSSVFRRMESVAYSGTAFLCLGQQGYLGYSTDGTTWSSLSRPSALQTTSTWKRVIYDGTRWVAFGSGGYISIATDPTQSSGWTNGVRQTTLYQADSIYWYGFAYGNNKYVALTYGGMTSYTTSITAPEWSTVVVNTNLGNNNWQAIAYGNSKFVAIGETGYISTSSDGINWSTATQNVNLGNAGWRDIAFDGTQFVAIGDGGYTSYSTDGVTWTQATQEITSRSNWRTITYGNSKYVALTYGSSTGYYATKGQPTADNNTLYNVKDTGLYLGSTAIANYTDVATSSTLGTVKPDNSTITVDTNGVISAVSDTSKADTDLSNLIDTGKIAIAHNAMPSSTSTSLTIGADGATYTAPADGYIYGAGGGSNYRIGIVIDGLYYGGSWITTSDIEILIPISKGKQFQFYYTNTTPTLAFIYAIGSESEGL